MANKGGEEVANGAGNRDSQPVAMPVHIETQSFQSYFRTQTHTHTRARNFHGLEKCMHAAAAAKSLLHSVSIVIKSTTINVSVGAQTKAHRPQHSAHTRVARRSVSAWVRCRAQCKNNSRPSLDGDRVVCVVCCKKTEANVSGQRTAHCMCMCSVSDNDIVRAESTKLHRDEHDSSAGTSSAEKRA